MASCSYNLCEIFFSSFLFGRRTWGTNETVWPITSSCAFSLPKYGPLALLLLTEHWAGNWMRMLGNRNGMKNDVKYLKSFLYSKSWIYTKRKVCKWKSIYSFCWHFRRFLTIEIISFSYELFFGSWRCMLGNFRPLRGNWSEYLWRVQSLSIKTHFRRLLGGGTLGSLAALFCSSRDLIAAASMELLPMFPLDLMRSSFSWFSLNVRASLTE